MSVPIDLAVLLPIVAALLAAGAAIGVLAGLFGVGGGAISVPVFFEVYGLLGMADEVRMPLAVGTSLAMILPTAIASTRAHARRGGVDFDLLKLWALPVLVGVVTGAALARGATAALYQTVFVCVAAVMAAKLLLGNAAWKVRDSLPGPILTGVYGGIVGFLSFLMGIGGGAISTLILTLHGRPIHAAVATSAGVGVLIAVPGTIGYILAGWGKPGLPGDAVGYVSALTLVVTVPVAMACTRLGVRLAHALPRTVLSRLFGLFLLVACLRFLAELL